MRAKIDCHDVVAYIENIGGMRRHCGVRYTHTHSYVLSLANRANRPIDPQPIFGMKKATRLRIAIRTKSGEK